MTKLNDPKKSSFITLAICFLSLAAIFAFSSTKALFVKKPEPITVVANIPYLVAEVLPKDQVKTGTFLIALDVDDWFERLQQKENPEKPIITYWQNPCGSLEIEYWLPRRDGTFFYSTDYKQIRWPAFFVTDRIEQKEGRFTVYPAKITGAIYVGFLGAVFSGLLTCLFTWLAFKPNE